MRRTMIGSTAVACTLALVTAHGAFARAGDRTAPETYPVATALCVNARAGEVPPKLRGQGAGVTAACYTLEHAFGLLVSTVDAAEATLLNTLSQQRALVSAACTKPVVSASACPSARATALSTNSAARTVRTAAVATFHASVEANRNTFWTTISSLRSSG